MNWFEKEGHWYSAPYRLYRTTRGWDAWLFGKQAGMLQRGFPTINAAKDFCRKHKDQMAPKAVADQ